MLIKVPPRWRIEPIDTSVVKGRNAVIDCDTDAYPPPTISWSRAEGKPWNEENFIFLPLIILFKINIEIICFTIGLFSNDNK